MGLSASYLNFALPFTLTDVRDIYFQDIQIAHVDINGQEKPDRISALPAGKQKPAVHGDQSVTRNVSGGRTDLGQLNWILALNNNWNFVLK